MSAGKNIQDRALQGLKAPRREPEASRLVPTPRVKPVKISVELDPQSYRRLGDYSRGLADLQGVARIANVEIVRALLDELHENEEIQQVVAKRIMASRV